MNGFSSKGVKPPGLVNPAMNPGFMRQMQEMQQHIMKARAIQGYALQVHQMRRYMQLQMMRQFQAMQAYQMQAAAMSNLQQMEYMRAMEEMQSFYQNMEWGEEEEEYDEDEEDEEMKLPETAEELEAKIQEVLSAAQARNGKAKAEMTQDY